MTIRYIATMAQKSSGMNMTEARNTSLQNAVNNVSLDNLESRVYTDYESYSYRLDGNNVDIENENVMLAENQLKYQGLISSINQEFTNLQTVMK